jgi:hypothetical protein
VKCRPTQSFHPLFDCKWSENCAESVDSAPLPEGPPEEEEEEEEEEELFGA